MSQKRLLLDSGDTSLSEEDFIPLVDATLSEEAIHEPWEVSISLVDAETIHRLNREYRGVDRVTDVLSFPLDERDPEGCLLLGDVVINLQKVKEQAKEYGHSEKRELSYLTVHSLLHLLGYDHEEEEDKRQMRDKEKRILANLAIGRDEARA